MKATLGRTAIVVDKDGFGALPIQRVDHDTAVKLLHSAIEMGLEFFDTAHAYTDSERKLGAALAGRRGRIVLASKTMAADGEGFTADLDTCLRDLKTDCVDLYQFHNPAACPLPGDGTGLYEAALAARQAGKIRFIGLTNHRLAVARQAVESGLYDTLQFPFSYLASHEETELVKRCQAQNVGFIAMKALAGGLLTDVAACRSWLARFEGVVPIWGIQRPSELKALAEARRHPAQLTEAQRQRIENDRAALSGSFCRGCGYCQPCPEGIEIHNCARMFLLLRRAPKAGYLSGEWPAKMEAIEHCRDCGACTSRCPYGLDTPALLRHSLQNYRRALAVPPAQGAAQ